MRTLSILLLACLMAAPALSITNPCPDILGIYFEEAANINCTAISPSTFFQVHFVMTNPTAEFVLGVEFGYQVASDDLVYRLEEIIPPGAVNVGDSSNLENGDYIMGFTTPIPGGYGQSLVCATWEMMTLQYSGISFYLGPPSIESIPDGYPGYLNSNESFVSLGYSTGSQSIPSAIANGDCLDPVTVTVNPQPEGLAAPWILDVPGTPHDLSGTGGAVFAGMPGGQYTITWGDVGGLVSPVNNPESQYVDFGGAITFTGQYGDSLVDIDDVQEYLPDGTPNSPYAGQSIHIRGTVIVPAGIYNPGICHIQDETGGVSYYHDSLVEYPQLGDVVDVYGVVGTWAGEIQLQDPTVEISSSGQVPAPVVLTPAEVLADFENVGPLTRVAGFVEVISVNSIELRTEGPENLRVYFDPDAGIDFSAAQLGDVCTVTGPVVVHNGRIQIRPRFQTDLVVSSTTADHVTVFSTTAHGGITQTGNTLGLSHETGLNGPGTRGSIGTFLTPNTEADLVPANPANPWFIGTTADWQENGSAAGLDLPAGATILHAQLVWSGSYGYFDDVSAFLDTGVELIHESSDALEFFPDPATAVTLDAVSEMGVPIKYYVRSAEATAFVAAHGAGIYQISGVPATQHELDNTRSAAGWVLLVAYGLESAPQRFMEFRVGCQFVDDTSPSVAMFSGFNTPESGDFEGRLLLTALEGDVQQPGDHVQIEPSPGNLVPLSSPGNPQDNFFASQINGIDGVLDTFGTAGNQNHDPGLGTPTVGGRQGWDLTGILLGRDAGHLVNGQTTTRVEVATNGDQIALCAIGLQLDHSGISPVPEDRIQHAQLLSCYPNPFNPQTTIRFELPRATAASLRIFDLSGRLVRTLLDGKVLEGGRHERVWSGRADDGRAVASGVYFYRLDAADLRETKRMVLIK